VRVKVLDVDKPCKRVALTLRLDDEVGRDPDKLGPAAARDKDGPRPNRGAEKSPRQAARSPMHYSGPASPPTRMERTVPSRDDSLDHGRSPAKPTGVARFTLAVFRMYLVDDLPAARKATTIGRVASMRALSLSRGGQSSAAGGRDARSRSGFGSIERFAHQRATSPRQRGRSVTPQFVVEKHATSMTPPPICRLPCRNRAIPLNLHGAFRATLLVPIMKGFLARPKRFELLTPRFVVIGPKIRVERPRGAMLQAMG